MDGWRSVVSRLGSVAEGSASTNGATGSSGVVRSRRRLGERWTLGHVAPVVLAVLAGVFVLTGLRDRSATVLVPVASEVIPAGSAVDGADIRLVRVHRSDSVVVAALLPASAVGSGWVAATRIDAGEPISRSVVSHSTVAGSGLGSMSIPVPVNQADGGAIVAGDLVDVIAPTGGGGAMYVAVGLRVLSVAPTSSSGVLAGTTSSYYIVVAVNRVTALRVTAALGASSSTAGTSGGVEVVRSTGETAPPAQAAYAPTTGSGTGSAGSTSEGGGVG